MTTTTIVRRLAVPALLIAGGAANATAGVTDQISFQARLIDDAGNPVSPGIHELDFHFFAEAEGGQPVGSVPNVEVQVSDDGVVSTAVGPVDSSWFAGTPRYLGITVDDDDDDPFGDELSPRIMLTAVPWALRALDLPAWTSISVQSGAFSEDVSVEGKLTLGGTPGDAGQLSLFAESPDAESGLAWHAPYGSSGRAYLKPDGAGNTIWYLTRGGYDTNGIAIDSNGNVGIRAPASASNPLDVGGLIGCFGVSSGGPTFGEFGFRSTYAEAGDVVPDWLGSGNPATFYRCIGEGRHSGFGVFRGSSISSSCVWLLQGPVQNRFEVRGVNSSQRVSEGAVHFAVGSYGWSEFNTNLEVNGTLETQVLRILGGADIVEGFETSGDIAIEPGTVVVIDPDEPGALTTSTIAYDFRVAGVVSGANGVKAGIRLGQSAVMDGDTEVAMAGRVYVKCSAKNGAIRPGDRLTTSSVAGCAMKATDAARSDGAVIGKAMSALDEGTGLVLVLVNLQ